MISVVYWPSCYSSHKAHRTRRYMYFRYPNECTTYFFRLTCYYFPMGHGGFVGRFWIAKSGAPSDTNCNRAHSNSPTLSSPPHRSMWYLELAPSFSLSMPSGDSFSFRFAPFRSMVDSISIYFLASYGNSYRPPSFADGFSGFIALHHVVVRDGFRPHCSIGME